MQTIFLTADLMTLAGEDPNFIFSESSQNNKWPIRLTLPAPRSVVCHARGCVTRGRPRAVLWPLVHHGQGNSRILFLFRWLWSNQDIDRSPPQHHQGGDWSVLLMRRYSRIAKNVPTVKYGWCHYLIILIGRAANASLSVNISVRKGCIAHR